MKKNIIVFKALIICILSIHFTLVALTQFFDLGTHFLQNDNVKKINDFYIYPYFEQNWGMFSPNPPQGCDYIIIQFKNDKVISKPIDIHKKVMQSSFKNIFSLDQRIIKYFSECYNDIVIKKENGFTNKQLLLKSHGLKSILNYSKIVLNNQKEFLANIQNNDTIRIDIYLVEDQIPKIYSKDLKIQKNYIVLKNINLSTKNEL